MINKLKNGFWLLAFLIVTGFGLLAFNAGTTLSPQPNAANTRAEQVQQLMQKANRGEPVADLTEAESSTPMWFRLVAKLASDKYMYGSDSIMATYQHYHSMPGNRQLVLKTHMMLGVLIMSLGLVQFWPHFRHQHRQLHRYSGAAYVTVGMLSMSMSGYTLLTNGIENTYNTYVFYVGLWLALFGALSGMLLGGYYIWRKQIAQHLGWQAMGYSWFLTAPMQRIDWVALAPFFPNATFNEVNAIVDVVLFAQTLLLGYVIFCINRHAGKTRDSEHPANAETREVSAFQRWGVILLTAFTAYSVVDHFALSPGLSGSAFSHNVIPASLSTLDGSLYQSMTLPWLYTLMVCVVIGLSMKLSLRSSLAIQQRGGANAMLVAATVAGLIGLYWGVQLGAPSHSSASGGAFYAITGALMLLFAALSARALHRSELHLFDERRRFLIASTIAPVTCYWVIALLSSTNIIPASYVAQGHGYILAATGTITLLILGAFLGAIYGSNTKRYRIH